MPKPLPSLKISSSRALSEPGSLYASTLTLHSARLQHILPGARVAAHRERPLTARGAADAQLSAPQVAARLGTEHVETGLGRWSATRVTAAGLVTCRKGGMGTHGELMTKELLKAFWIGFQQYRLTFEIKSIFQAMKVDKG